MYMLRLARPACKAMKKDFVVCIISRSLGDCGCLNPEGPLRSHLLPNILKHVEARPQLEDGKGKEPDGSTCTWCSSWSGEE